MSEDLIKWNDEYIKTMLKMIKSEKNAVASLSVRKCLKIVMSCQYKSGDIEIKAIKLLIFG